MLILLASGTLPEQISVVYIHMYVYMYNVYEWTVYVEYFHKAISKLYPVLRFSTSGAIMHTLSARLGLSNLQFDGMFYVSNLRFFQGFLCQIPGTFNTYFSYTNLEIC